MLKRNLIILMYAVILFTTDVKYFGAGIVLMGYSLVIQRLITATSSYNRFESKIPLSPNIKKRFIRYFIEEGIELSFIWLFYVVSK